MSATEELLATCSGGIIMTGHSVLATRDRRKTQTRRALSKLDAENVTFFACEEGMDGKPQPSDAVFTWSEDGHSGRGLYVACGEYPEEGSVILHPRYHPGQRYYVKETWCHQVDAVSSRVVEGAFWYRVDEEARNEILKLDGDGSPVVNRDGTLASPWLSPMRMPRAAARYVIEIESVRVQRLQDISEEDVLAEGAERAGAIVRMHGIHGLPIPVYARAWDAINGKLAPWASNPWVYAYSYHLVTA